MKKFILSFSVLSMHTLACGNAYDSIISASKSLEEKSKAEGVQLLNMLEKNPQQSRGELFDTTCTLQTVSRRVSYEKKLTLNNTLSQKESSSQSCGLTSAKKDKLNCELPSQNNYVSTADILVFVSLSLGSSTLKQLHHDAQKIGGRLILRGLYKDSFRLTQQKIKELKIIVDIDPTLFEQFNIKEVPTFILTEPYQNNQSFKYDQLTGNVTLSYALEKFHEEGEIMEAKTFLKKLKEKAHA